MVALLGEPTVLDGASSYQDADGNASTIEGKAAMQPNAKAIKLCWGLKGLDDNCTQSPFNSILIENDFVSKILVFR